MLTTHAQTAAIYDQPVFATQGISISGKWGIKDKHLYQASKGIFQSLASGQQPFFAILQTIDTHSKAVSFGDYPEPYNDECDSFVAADHMVFEFLAWIKKQSFYKNTTILIVGDHLYMGNSLGTQKLQGFAQYIMFSSTQ